MFPVQDQQEITSSWASGFVFNLGYALRKSCRKKPIKQKGWLQMTSVDPQ